MFLSANKPDPTRKSQSVLDRYYAAACQTDLPCPKDRNELPERVGRLLAMIDQAPLSDRAKKNASDVFRRLGDAEARVHGLPVEKVHFHEVGAVDSIADIVGTCLGLALLGVEEIQCSAVNTGSGTVKTEHGLLPVPAPATAALLAGKPIYARGPKAELTTPTGAAVAVTLASRFGAVPAMRLTSVGYGAGGREFPNHASVLRVMLGEASAATEAVIEANIDDLTQQVLGNAVGRLLDNGALDVTFRPTFLKNKRPGTLLRVVTRPEDRERLAQIVVASFGPSACALSLTSAAFRPAG